MMHLNVADAEGIVRLLLPGGFPVGPDWFSNPFWSGLNPGVMQWTAPYELRKLTASFERAVGLGIPQDVAQCTFHFLNLTEGDPDDTWTTEDYETVELLFDTFWQNINIVFFTDIVLKELSWRADGPAFKPHGSSVAPVLRTVERDDPGEATGASLPPQVAMSVTEVTAAKFTVTDVEGDPGTHLRNRWGRFYLPPPTSNALNEMRISDAACAQVADGTEIFYEAAVDAELIPVMYSPTTGSSWSIDAIHVDDIFDVIRSRRFDGPLSRHARAID